MSDIVRHRRYWKAIYVSLLSLAIAMALMMIATHRTYAQNLHSGSEDGSSSLRSDAIGADDLIELNVSYCPELNHNFRVSSDGSLALPLLHEHLTAAGYTPGELSARIKEALEKEHILVDPVVNVTVVESRSRPVSVVGAVNHPITFQANERTTLIDALAHAEGMSPSAGGTILVTAKRADGQPYVTRISAADLLSGDVPEDNLPLHGGEEVRVPEGKKIFVAGNVHRPGMYPMQNDSDTTVVKALALSSGLDQYSTNVAFIYRKPKAGGEREEIQVPLKLILKRRAPDVAMQADDILYIPTNDGKRLTGKILNQIAGFGQTAEAGLVLR